MKLVGTDFNVFPKLKKAVACKHPQLLWHC